MIHLPSAAGLVVCQQAVIEENTRNATLVNSFKRLPVDAFPTPPQQFTVYAILTDGLGEMTLSLEVAPLDTLETILAFSWHATFASRLQEVRVLVRAKAVSFPRPGPYQVSLLADGEPLAQRVITLFRPEGQS